MRQTLLNKCWIKILFLLSDHLLHKFWWQMVSFSGNLWQPPHLSADDRSHFTNALMSASRFSQCPWRSPRLSQAAVEGDGHGPESSIGCEECLLLIIFNFMYLLIQHQLNIWSTVEQTVCIHSDCYGCHLSWLLQLPRLQSVTWPFE